MYNPIATIERIAHQISETHPDAAVGLLTAATEIESKLAEPERARLTLAAHWAEHEAV